MPSILTLVLSVLMVGAGASLAMQQVLNASLRSALGSPWWAAFASYAVGAAATLALALALPGPPPSLPRLPWFVWSAGLFGAGYIVAAILAVPRLGVAGTLALVVVGQMGASLAFDRIGLLGLPQQPVGPLRVAGAACLVLGVVLVRR